MAPVLKYLRISCGFIVLAGIAAAQNQSPKLPQPDRADSYYHYSLGHLYAELAGTYGNKGDYFNKAIENYRLAMKEDSSATFIGEELSDLYIQSGRLREAVVEAEDALKKDPDDLNARRLLARIYTRLIGDQQQNRIDETMVKKAIEQYQKITEKDPNDSESWLMLGRLQAASHNSVESIAAYKKALALDADNEDALSGLAMVYAEAGNSKDAADLLRRAAEKDPNPRSLKALAAAYEQMKDYALAAETLRRALDASDGDVDLKRAYGDDLVRADQVDAALKVFDEMVAADPKDAQSELRISQIYRQKHDYTKAQEASEKAKAIDPTNLEVRYNDVSILEAQGRVPDAISTLKDILESTTHKTYEQPQAAMRIELLERLAYLYRENDQWGPAVDALRQIGDLDPEAAGRAEAEVIDTYRSAKDFTKAQQEADAALKKFPNDRAVKSMHASLLADMGKTDQAVAETKSLFNGKNDRESWLQLAQIYEKAKNWTEMGKALAEAEKLSTSKDDRENIYFMRGAMYERMKKYDEAEADFHRVLEINPDNASALNYLGYMLADRNIRLPEALELIKKALDQEPNNYAYLDSMGWVDFRLNKLPEAEQSLRRALELWPTDPTVHDHLGDVYFHQGKTREAIAQWQSSLKNYETSAPSDMDHEDMAKIQKKLDNAKVRLARETGAKQ
ncbi:MAG: tetratricopeptide repeat protein [Bryobacteraceae bacterium]|jgi:tetratricopeptide (TPR) repeat protein